MSESAAKKARTDEAERPLVAIAFVGSMHHGIRKAGIKKEAKKRAEAKAD